MCKISKNNLLHLLLVLAGMTMVVSGAHAEREEEKLLLLPTAEIGAATKNYDHFFRIISRPSFPSRQPAFAITVYFNPAATTSPEHGFICFKIRVPDGTFWERSRALTTEEVDTVCNLIEQEEIFSLPAKQRWDSLARYSVRDGTTYFFSHLDKIQHIKEEITRSPETSNPAGRVMAGLGEIIKDYSIEFDKSHDPEKGYLPDTGKVGEKPKP